MAGRTGAQPAAETEDSVRRSVAVAGDSPPADQRREAAKSSSPETAPAGGASQMPTPYRLLRARLVLGPYQGDWGETGERPEVVDDVYFSPLDNVDRNSVTLRLLRSEPSTPASRQLLNSEDYDDDDEPDTPPNGSAAYDPGEARWTKSSSFASVASGASMTTADGRPVVALFSNSPPTTPSMNRFPGSTLASTASCPELLSLFETQASSTRLSSPLRESTPLSDTPHSAPAEPTTKQRCASQVYNGTRLKPSPRVVHSLWDYLKEEITTSDVDDISDVKSERVKNFLNVPQDFEKLMLFGYFVCLDAFLYVFTILPIRVVLAAFAVVCRIVSRNRALLTPAHMCDIYSFIFFAATCCMLQRIDASRMYHSIRGQAVIKLYVIFNVLEILDRLCCSFGQDILDSFFARVTDIRRARTKNPKTPKKQLRFLPHFVLAMAYVFGHTIVLFYQSVTLNVAINSHSNALLTLLMSNQFVEIKGSVFKKFERENLFQLSCSDIVERFQLSVFLTIITLRNLLELSASSSPLAPSPFPKFLAAFMPMASVVESLLSPIIVVMASELVVDWLKHAFITKFNGIRPSAYGRFVDVLCSDLVRAGTKAKAKAPKEHGRIEEGDGKAEEPTPDGSVRKVSTAAARSQSVQGGRRIPSAGDPFVVASESDSAAGRRESNLAWMQPQDGIPGLGSQGEIDPGEKRPRVAEGERRGTLDEKTVDGGGFRAGGDVASDTRYTLVDQSRVVARRIGFAAMPLACLVVRMLAQTLWMLDTFGEDGGESGDDGVLGILSWSSSARGPVPEGNSTAAGAQAESAALPSVLMAGAIYEPVASILQNVTAAASEYFPLQVREVWEVCRALAWKHALAAITHVRLGVVEPAARLVVGSESARLAVEKVGEHVRSLARWGCRDVLGGCGSFCSLGSWTRARMAALGFLVLVGLAAFVCLVSLKIIVGIHLLNYAHRRLEGTMEREARDKASADAEKKEREAERKRLHQELSDVTKDLTWKVEADAPPTLETIDRYTLFKSRIP